MGIRILCTGDIHIGRRSSRVSGSYRSADIWTSIVDLAVLERVDLLAISGDVVDEESKSYEALGPLQQGLERLCAAGIDTVAVTGNHDHDVLPRLVEATGTERFHLLGVGGQWERRTLARDGRPYIHVDGWSFPRERVTFPPVQAYVSGPDDGVPVLGLLHGEVNVPASPYAPIDTAALWAHNVDAWLLGHIHGSRVYEGHGHSIALYPGSPLALDPGEPGTHGVWMVELGDDRVPAIQQIALSPVRYDSLDIDASDIADEGDFQRQLNDAVISLGQRTNDALRVISARLRFTGRSTARALIPAWIDRAREDIASYSLGNVTVEVDRITSDVRPHIDLAAVAQGADPAGETAKLILALDDPAPDPIYQELIRTTIDDLRSVYLHPIHTSLRTREGTPGVDAPGESDARALLADRAWHVLSTLIAQKEVS